MAAAAGGGQLAGSQPAVGGCQPAVAGQRGLAASGCQPAVAGQAGGGVVVIQCTLCSLRVRCFCGLFVVMHVSCVYVQPVQFVYF